MKAARLPSWLIWMLRTMVAAGLAADAVIHLRLAEEYGFAFPEGLGGEVLFEVQASLAIIAAAGVLIWASRLTYAFAFAVALSAFVAVVLARYVEVPSLGPLPSMYEPVWFLEKSLSAIAEGLAVVAALALLVTMRLKRAALPPSHRGRDQSVTPVTPNHLR